MSRRTAKPSDWSSIKTRTWQYQEFARCSEATGRSILSLHEEACRDFIEDVMPIYIDAATLTREKIRSRRGGDPSGKRRKPAKVLPKKTQKNPVETVTNTP